jgi:hypothetical protein
VNQVGDFHFLVYECLEAEADHCVVGEENAEAAIVFVRLVVPITA